MLQTVQLSIGDSRYAAALREAVARSCAWHVELVDRPDPGRYGVLVLDEPAFLRLPLPLTHPERIVLITRKDPELLAEAWDAGIVSVVSEEDPINTVLMAVMAAALRVVQFHAGPLPSGISPSARSRAESIAPQSAAVAHSKPAKVH